MRGVAGASVLVAQSDNPVLVGDGVSNVSLTGLGFDGDGKGSTEAFSGLVHLNDSTDVTLEGCAFAHGRGNGLFLSACSGRIANVTATDFGQTAIFCQ